MKPQRWPILTDEDRAAVARVFDRGVLSGAGAPEMRALETEFASAVGARFCLATNSGTSALHIALAAAGVGPGDEVIVPALGFIATAQAVLHAGATPVFADVDPVTYNIDVADAARRVNSRTRAIVPVHLHGLPADMDGIAALGRQAGLTVVEDAAQAHGALYKGRAVGTLGAMGAFSLNSTKNLPAGEGGLFVTESEELYARAARVRFDGLEPPVVPRDRTHVFHKYRVRLDPARAGLSLGPVALRDRLLEALRAEGVEAVLWQTAPLPAHPLFALRERYPSAAAALESTLLIGSQSYPLFAQPLEVVDAWADGFERAWNAIRRSLRL